MKKILVSLVCFAVFGIAFSFMGANPVSATPADPSKGTGCLVSGDFINYTLDASCSAHDVLKFDNDGNFQFYEYHDHGKIPEGSVKPKRAINTTYEQCLLFSFGVVCGTISESVTPSGDYKSSFSAH